MNIFLYGGRYNTCMWPVMTGPPEQNDQGIWSFDKDGSIRVCETRGTSDGWWENLALVD